MPQLRTFSGFASTPNIGSAFVGGAGVAQRAQEAAMNAANERARIGNAYAIAQMEANQRQMQLQQQAMLQAQELEAKKEMLNMQLAKESQELEIQKAYQTAQLGLKERDLKLEESMFTNEVSQAAEVSKNRLAMQRDVEELMAAGESPSKALSMAIARHGAGAKLPGGALSSVVDQQGEGNVMGEDFEMGKMYDVPDQKGWRFGRTGPNSGQYFPPTKDAPIPEDLSFDPSKVQYGNRVFDKPAAKQAEKLEKERDAIKKELRSADFELHRRTLAKAEDPKAELSAGDKARIKEYRERQAEIEDLNKQIAELRGSLTNSPSLPRGATAPSSRTNRVGRFEIIAE